MEKQMQTIKAEKNLLIRDSKFYSEGIGNSKLGKLNVWIDN